mgnify:CR=1 FL=1
MCGNDAISDPYYLGEFTNFWSYWVVKPKFYFQYIICRNLVWFQTFKSDSSQRKIPDDYISFLSCFFDNVFTRQPDVLAVILSKFKFYPKIFATYAFGLGPFLSILEICYIYDFLKSALGTGNPCSVAFVYINFFHLLSSFYLFHNMPILVRWNFIEKHDLYKICSNLFEVLSVQITCLHLQFPKSEGFNSISLQELFQIQFLPHIQQIEKQRQSRSWKFPQKFLWPNLTRHNGERGGRWFFEGGGSSSLNYLRCNVGKPGLFITLCNVVSWNSCPLDVLTPIRLNSSTICRCV